MSRLSKKHITITPDECNNCRLCEESCPFGTIDPPNEGQKPENKRREIKRLAVLLVFLPVIVFVSGWSVSRLAKPFSRYHFTIRLAEAIQLEDSGQITETTDETETFRALGESKEDLFLEAEAIRDHFRTGSWILGGFLGLVIMLKLIGLTIHKKREKYEIDKGGCLSCARCCSYCPYELVRLGIIKPEEIIKHES